MNDPVLKPIETRYAGYRFRSRLEARWAVFLDALAANWSYEREGFELPDGGRYLPDFWLEHESWLSPRILEIKPPRPLTSREVANCQAADAIAKGHCFLAQGDPLECLVFVWSERRKSVFQLSADYHALGAMLVGMPAELAARAAKGEDWRTFTGAAARAARGARFEHGENQRQRGFQGVHNFVDRFALSDGWPA